jgi:hypothetical protein
VKPRSGLPPVSSLQYSHYPITPISAHVRKTAGSAACAGANATDPEPATLFMIVAVLIGRSIANARQSYKFMRW